MLTLSPDLAWKNILAEYVDFSTITFLIIGEKSYNTPAAIQKAIKERLSGGNSLSIHAYTADQIFVSTLDQDGDNDFLVIDRHPESK